MKALKTIAILILTAVGVFGAVLFGHLVENPEVFRLFLLRDVGNPEAAYDLMQWTNEAIMYSFYAVLIVAGILVLKSCWKNIKAGYGLTPEARAANRIADQQKRAQQRMERSQAWTRITYYLLGGAALFFLLCVYIYLNK